LSQRTAEKLAGAVNLWAFELMSAILLGCSEVWSPRSAQPGSVQVTFGLASMTRDQQVSDVNAVIIGEMSSVYFSGFQME
jgi:hypothetical protein